MRKKAINKAIDHIRLQQKKVLLAEDIRMNQNIAKKILESCGCEVTIANNGKEAIELLKQNFYHCILMDIQMPELDGLAATELIRKLPDPAKSSIPIIALTANTLESDKEKYINAGMNDCITKPIDEEKLVAAITKNLFQTNDGEAGPAKRSDNENPDPEKIYDLSLVLSISGGNQDFIKKMIALFIETVPQNVAELKKATESENWEQVGKVAHKLKSTIDSMGIKSIYQDIRSVENGGKHRVNLEMIPSLVKKIELVIDRCIQQLHKEL